MYFVFSKVIIEKKRHRREERKKNMILQKFFPNAFKAHDLTSFIVALIIYAVIGIVGGFVIGILAGIPLIGLFAGIAGALLELYTVVGVVLSILVFLKVLK